MKKNIIIITLASILFALDRISKNIFLSGFEYKTNIIDFYLVYNKGVAFSLLSFLDEKLKYIQIAIFALLILYLLKEKKILQEHIFSVVFIFVGGISNLLDRFLYPGVVDFIAWHYYFNFAVFNLADIFINIGVGLVIIKELFKRRK